MRIARILFKLTQGANLLTCSEIFVVGRNSISMLLQDVVHAINVVFRGEITWPQGPALLQVKGNFRRLCSLLEVVGAIDGIHIAISKLKVEASNYFYFKSRDFSINCQAVVDSGNLQRISSQI